MWWFKGKVLKFRTEEVVTQVFARCAEDWVLKGAPKFIFSV